MKRAFSSAGLVLIAALALVACSTTAPTRAYHGEAFTRDTPFEYYSSHDPESACAIGKRALLSQGYQIDSSPQLTVRGEKYFQPQPDRATKLSITLVCLPSSLGSAIYANALETHYELKSSGSSAGVSVAGFGSLSLPWTADKDALVKVGEETVTAPGFYQRLFDLIKVLDN